MEKGTRGVNRRVRGERGRRGEESGRNQKKKRKNIEREKSISSVGKLLPTGEFPSFHSTSERQCSQLFPADGVFQPLVTVERLGHRRKA